MDVHQSSLLFNAVRTIRLAAQSFYDLIAVSTSFQTQSLPLLHLISRHLSSAKVLFVDTGYHFPETLAFRNQVVEMLSLNLRVVRADEGATSDLNSAREPLYRTNPDLCCELNKIQPVRAAMGEYRAWISGIRRDQSAVRAQAREIEKTTEGITRIHPMLDWTQADIEAYIREHNLPRHPLDARGYTSIGCRPCTRPPLIGGDLRSGRWAGTGKTECGLHTQLRRTDNSEP